MTTWPSNQSRDQWSAATTAASHSTDHVDARGRGIRRNTNGSASVIRDRFRVVG